LYTQENNVALPGYALSQDTYYTVLQ